VNGGQREVKEETRIRMGAKQTAKGAIQLDLTAEAPTVEQAGQLMEDAIDRLVAVVQRKGFAIVEAS